MTSSCSPTINKLNGGTVHQSCVPQLGGASYKLSMLVCVHNLDSISPLPTDWPPECWSIPVHHPHPHVGIDIRVLTGSPHCNSIPFFCPPFPDPDLHNSYSVGNSDEKWCLGGCSGKIASNLWRWLWQVVSPCPPIPFNRLLYSAPPLHVGQCNVSWIKLFLYCCCNCFCWEVIYSGRLSRDTWWILFL